jgi:hypothetical protein
MTLAGRESREDSPSVVAAGLHPSSGMRARLILALVLAVALGTAHAGCPDGDVDGTCDAADVCTNDGALRLTEAAMRITGADAPAGDERLRLRGRIVLDVSTVDDFADPAEHGMRFTLERYDGALDDHEALVSAVVPGGAGWRARADGTAWTYRDARGRHGGVTRISLKRRQTLPVIPAAAGPDTRETLEVQVLVRGSAFSVDADLLDGFLPDATVLHVGIGFGPVGHHGSRCAFRIFPNQAPPTPCGVSGNGSVVQCATAAPAGACQLGEPRDVVVCETMNVMWLQERHRAQAGDYFVPSGATCDGLPGWVAVDGVSCDLTATGDAFVVSMASAHEAGYACSYDSAADEGERLRCLYD